MHDAEPLLPSSRDELPALRQQKQGEWQRRALLARPHRIALIKELHLDFDELTQPFDTPVAFGDMSAAHVTWADQAAWILRSASQLERMELIAEGLEGSLSEQRDFWNLLAGQSLTLQSLEISEIHSIAVLAFVRLSPSLRILNVGRLLPYDHSPSFGYQRHDVLSQIRSIKLSFFAFIAYDAPPWEADFLWTILSAVSGSVERVCINGCTIAALNGGFGGVALPNLRSLTVHGLIAPPLEAQDVLWHRFTTPKDFLAVELSDGAQWNNASVLNVLNMRPRLKELRNLSELSTCLDEDGGGTEWWHSCVDIERTFRKHLPAFQAASIDAQLHTGFDRSVLLRSIEDIDAWLAELDGSAVPDEYDDAIAADGSE